MQKRFGQNFLLNQNVRERIVELVEMKPNSVVWEIGPGMGAITSLMAGYCKKLNVFEIDRGFILLLKELYKKAPAFNIIEGDALKNWPLVAKEESTPDILIGNLPYNVGSLIIASVIEKALLPERMAFTVQKEVALRMSEKSGGKQYSSFSMLCGLDYEVKKTFDIQPGSFYPKPEVVSSVALMVKKAERTLAGYSLDDPEIRGNYFKIIRDLFKQRRKTINNNLIKSGFLTPYEQGQPGLAAKLCSQCGINPADRGERISIEQAWKLAGLASQV